MKTTTHHARHGVAAGVLVVAVGLSVRFPITSVSPLLDELQPRYGLGATGISLITAIPVLLFGVASLAAPALVLRLGLGRALTVLLAALAAATLLRPLSTPLLFAGTVVVGAAIALLGILAPQIIRHSLSHRGGFWTGVYTTSFGISAAAGAALTVPLFTHFGGRVDLTLAAWGVPLMIALGLAIGCTPKAGLGATGAVDGVTAGRPTLRSAAQAPGIWPVTGFFACQALIYFSLTAWLPTLLIDRGLSASAAGGMLAWMSIAGLPASLLAPTLASRVRLRTGLIVTVSALSALGLTVLAIGPASLSGAAIAVLGIAQSAAFGLAVALIVFTAPSARHTAPFSAFSQGIGYACAALGPLLIGLLHDAGLSWAILVLMLTGASAGQLIFGVWATRASR